MYPPVTISTCIVQEGPSPYVHCTCIYALCNRHGHCLCTSIRCRSSFQVDNTRSIELVAKQITWESHDIYMRIHDHTLIVKISSLLKITKLAASLYTCIYMYMDPHTKLRSACQLTLREG